MPEIIDKARKFTCPAIRESIKDKEVAEVMSNELMGTIRNNTYIPVDIRYKTIDQINAQTREEKKMKEQLQGIKRPLGVLYQKKELQVCH